MTVIRADTSELLALSKALDDTDRAALPVSIRSTLNDLGFNTRTIIPYTAMQRMNIRRPAFFRRFTRVDKAVGFDVETMQCQVGIILGQPSATRGMAVQERGATITNRGEAPTVAARGGSEMSQVKKRNYLETVQSNLVVGPSRKRASKKSEFMAKIYMARKRKLFIQDEHGNIIRPRTKPTKSGRGEAQQVDFKMEVVYRKLGTVTVQPTHFVRDSGLAAVMQINRIYFKHVQKQVARVMKKRGLS